MSNNRNLSMWLVKVALVIWLIILAYWVMSKANGQPLPPKVRTVLQSPKAAEFNASLKPAAPINLRLVLIVPTVHTNLVTWTSIPSWKTSFRVEWKPEIMNAWVVIGYKTNSYSYLHVTSSDHGFYRVGAFWP